MRFRVPAKEARRRMVAACLSDDDLKALREALVACDATQSAADEASVLIAWHAMVFVAPSETRSPSKVSRSTLEGMVGGIKTALKAKQALDPEISVAFSASMATDRPAKIAWTRLEKDLTALLPSLEKFTAQYRGKKPSNDSAIEFWMNAAKAWKAATGRWPVEARAETPNSRPPKSPLYKLVRELVEHAAAQYGLPSDSSLLTPNQFVEAIKAAKRSAAK